MVTPQKYNTLGEPYRSPEVERASDLERYPYKFDHSL